MTQLEQFFENAAKQIAVYFKEHGEVVPMWHAVDRNGENILLVTPWNGYDEKHDTLDAVRALFRERGVKRYVFMTEAWSLFAPSIEEARKHVGHFEEHPDRREILALQAEDIDGSSLMGWYFILRPEHGPATLSPFKLSDANRQEGAFAGMLR
jgi:hypothetical protein